MYARLLVLLGQALKFAAPVTLGYFINDVTAMIGNLPIVGPFFQTKDSGGRSPWYVVLVALALGTMAVLWLVYFLFPKTKKS
jgi:H+/Cl- antiporter ClcA